MMIAIPVNIILAYLRVVSEDKKGFIFIVSTLCLLFYFIGKGDEEMFIRYVHSFMVIFTGIMISPLILLAFFSRKTQQVWKMFVVNISIILFGFTGMLFSIFHFFEGVVFTFSLILYSSFLLISLSWEHLGELFKEVKL